ncbi:hypothetical protein NFO65_13490 [Neorhizobium galegae]|uniref:hypothetical protein n=1 Tax=Neorhizobium galegae TaxID=399 RepID=UPI0021019AF8|nr:hypothetical protein [Neorhizobium galegae]MCQ1571740.1 hypothetical protein [Neorhizobium galegae]
MDQHATLLPAQTDSGENSAPRMIDPWLIAAPGSRLSMIAREMRNLAELVRPSLQCSKPTEARAVDHLFRSLAANVALWPDASRTLVAIGKHDKAATRWDSPAFDAKLHAALTVLEDEGYVMVDRIENRGGYNDNRTTHHVFRPDPSLAQAVVEALEYDGPLATTYAPNAPLIFLSKSKLVFGPDATLMRGLTPDWLVKYEKAELELSTASELRRLNSHKAFPPEITLADGPGGARVFNRDDPMLTVRRCFFAPRDGATFEAVKVPSKGPERWTSRVIEVYRLNSGGRFFGGFWQTMAREERLQRITINGEAVAEVGYEDFDSAVGVRHGIDLAHLQYLQSRAIAETAARVNEGLPLRDGLLVPRSSVQATIEKFAATGLWITGQDLPVRVYE